MPQLAMHSSVELMAEADAEYMYEAIKSFYSSSLEIRGDKITVR
jgi:aspartyl aminopeptidase